jgi:YD repeat-containing protein
MQTKFRLVRRGAAALSITAVLSLAQSPNTGFIGTGVSISFQQSGPVAIGRGVSISFQNSADKAGRGVSVSFTGATIPSAGQTTANYGSGNGSARVQSGFSSDPVNTATGNYYSTHTDLAVPGKGLSFAFARFYNSADPYSGPLGIGWTHSFNLLLTVNPDNTVEIQEADGGVIAFAPNAGGGYSPVTPGVFDTLSKNSDNSFTLTRTTQTKFNFSAQGNLLSITDRNGNAQTLVYAHPAISPASPILLRELIRCLTTVGVTSLR